MFLKSGSLETILGKLILRNISCFVDDRPSKPIFCFFGFMNGWYEGWNQINYKTCYASNFIYLVPTYCYGVGSIN